MRFDTAVLGNHQSTAALISSLIADGLAPALLVTLGGQAKQKAAIASVADELAGWAEARCIAVYECDGYRLTSERDRAFFADNDFGLGVCTDWQHLLPAHVLEAFNDGVYGFHGSLLEFPNGRGRSPFNWSLRLGGEAVFHNCFRYTEGADNGDVFNTTAIAIGRHDTIRALQFKALIDSRITIRRLLRAYRERAIALTPQPKSASVWLPKLTPEDSRLHFAAMTERALLDVIRASSRPFNGAFAESEEGERVTIWRAQPYDGPIDPLWEAAGPGQVVAAALDQALIRCRDGWLFATELSVEAEGIEGRRFA